MKSPISILNAPRGVRIADSDAQAPMPSEDQINSFVSSFVGWVEARPVDQSEEDAIDEFLTHYRRTIRNASERHPLSA